jgi:hypothetical protein
MGISLKDTPRHSELFGVAPGGEVVPKQGMVIARMPVVGKARS